MTECPVYPTIVHMLIDAAQTAPENEALVHGQERLTYRQLLNSVTGFANELTSLGMKNERVATVMGNSNDICVALFAVNMANAQIVPMNPMYTEHELRPMLSDAEVKGVIYDGSTKDVVEKLADELNIAHRFCIEEQTGRRLIEWCDQDLPVPIELPCSADPAILQFTGGTTGRAKGADLTHQAIFTNVWQMETMLPVRRDMERVLCVMPLFHCYAWSRCYFSMVYGRGAMVILSQYHPQEVVETFGRESITLFGGSPTLFTSLINYSGFDQADFSNMYLSFSGSAPLPEELIVKWEQATGTPILEGYGQSESGPVLSFNPSVDNRKIGSVGLPIPETEIEIVDTETGEKKLPVGEAGHIRVRGPQMMSGYRNRPEETREALRDGWLYTGDIGVIDEDGFLFITGRKKEMILVSGYNVFPREIEDLLFEHDSVKEAAVVGKPDEYRGELPVAFIVPMEGVTVNTDELKKYCEQNLASYKIPAEFRIVDSLLKTAVGKLDKVAMAEIVKSPVT